MKRYIRSAQRTVLGPLERLKSELGISDWHGNAKLYSSSDSKWDYCISSNYGSLSQDDIEKFTSRLKKIGAKYISKRYGRIYFCYNMSKLQSEYQTELQQAKDDYTAELNAIDIDQYKPDNATINKLIAYRDKGSMVNVKAIKDVNKVIKYYYAACIIDWGELRGACKDKLCGLGNGISYDDKLRYEDLLAAISRRVEQNPDYKDKRSEMDQRNGNKNSGDLFTFEDKNCWLPKSILNYFVDNNIPVHFGKRTSGSYYDRNGRQWSEVEHLILYPDSDNPIKYDIVVHTDEGGGPSTYTGNGTDERVSAKKVIEDIDYRVQARNRRS